MQFIVFRLDQQRFALPLEVVERVVRAAEVTPLPDAPPSVLGALDVHGQVLPVFNLRRRFFLPEREVLAADWFLLARTARQDVVLVVDESEGVVSRLPGDIVTSSDIVGGLEQFPGVVRLDDGLALIQDLDRFLSQDDAQRLDESMGRLRHA